MSKKIKLIIWISILSLIVLTISIFSVIKKQNDYRDTYTNLYNINYDSFYKVFRINGVIEYIDGKMKIKNAIINIGGIGGGLSKQVKVVEENGIEVNNYLDFFQEYYYNQDEYREKRLSTPDLSKEEEKELISKLNLGIDVYTATSDELNVWLDKAVKEYLLKEYKLKPPKGF